METDNSSYDIRKINLILPALHKHCWTSVQTIVDQFVKSAVRLQTNFCVSNEIDWKKLFEENPKKLCE